METVHCADRSISRPRKWDLITKHFLAKWRQDEILTLKNVKVKLSLCF